MSKFKVPSVPPTTPKTVRFPNDMIDRIEDEIKCKNCTFSAFVVEAVKVALADLAEEKENK